MEDLFLFFTPTPAIMPEVKFSLREASVQAVILSYSFYLLVIIFLTIIYHHVSISFKKYLLIFILFIPIIVIWLQYIFQYIPVLSPSAFWSETGFPFVTFLTTDTADRYVYRNAYFLNLLINLILVASLYGLLEIRRTRTIKRLVH